MQNQRDEVELYHRLQSQDEIAEQGSEVAVRGDRFRDRKECLVLHPQRIGSRVLQRFFTHKR